MWEQKKDNYKTSSNCVKHIKQWYLWHQIVSWQYLPGQNIDAKLRKKKKNLNINKFMGKHLEQNIARVWTSMWLTLGSYWKQI